MGRYIKKIANLESANNALVYGLAWVGIVGCAGIYFAQKVPHQIDFHMAPNLQPGQVVSVKDGVSPVEKPNVYGFAYYTWQQINRWSKDGAKDYGSQLFAFQHYVTPSCQEYLKSDIKKKSGLGELNGRTRSLSELPGNAFSDARVVPDGANAWTAYLDLQLVETLKGQVVKDVAVRYPVRVVRYEVDLEKNPWRLGVDCGEGTKPQRLQALSSPGAAASAPRPVSVPKTPADVTLPQVSSETAGEQL